MKKVQAKIEWLTEYEGGRQAPPPGPRYITIAQFDDERDKYPREAWSLVLEFCPSQNNSREIVAEAWFLSDDAPQYLLHEESFFELFEGHQLVARGQVL